ncbi:hypothetical protein ACCO45_002735 [Purpureocillium lilacinum]|uniref:Uncharacterized protein n=1 Tax=Purpureocillium lilacinum TaxID=33203 RepID=A0ACC4DYT3_PURLI
MLDNWSVQSSTGDGLQQCSDGASLLEQSTETAAGTRRYRSKSQRPCDLCRARKVLCNIPDPAKPCQLCHRTRRPCTFVAVTSKKQRTGSATANTANVYDGIVPAPAEMRPVPEPPTQLTESESPEETLSTADVHPFAKFIFDPSWSTTAEASTDVADIGPPAGDDPDSVFNILQDTELSHLWPMNSPGYPGAGLPTGHRLSPQSVNGFPSPGSGASMDQRPNYSSAFIGFSNESDPFILEHFPYNSADEVDFFMVTYRRPSRLPVSAAHAPVHILQSKLQSTSHGRGIIESAMAIDNVRERLEKLVDVETGVSLVNLYLRFVFQTLPILSRSLIQNDVPRFVRKELHAPHLSTVQIFLLLLNHASFDPVAVDSPFAWSLAASMTAVAQSLGLHMDPTDWKLPASEIRLRRRLWWAVVVEHSWRAITHGQASMLHDDEWSVTPLAEDDFVMDVPSDSAHVQPDHFLRLCSLTQITNGIRRQFFSLRAVSQPQSLDTLIELAKWPRQQLHEWLEGLPESLRMGAQQDDHDNESPQSQGSLHLAYFTAHILLLRALLRPIVSKDADPKFTSSTAPMVLQASRALIQTMIDFVRGLDVKHRSGFWPAYNRHCFCYPGLFCYMLCLQPVEPHMVAADRRLLAKWRNVLRTRVQSWQLLRFAIVKVDALFWKKLDNLVESPNAC